MILKGIRPVMDRAEVDRAFKIGVAKSAVSMARGYQHTYKYEPTAEESRLVGGMSAVSERLVAFVTGRRWLSGEKDPGIPDTPGEGDVEGGIGVRWTELEHGSLIVYERDKDPKFSLVLGPDRYRLRIRGWMWIEDAKQPEYWRKEGPVERGRRRYNAYFVPQDAPMWQGIRGLRKERGRGYGGEGGDAC